MIDPRMLDEQIDHFLREDIGMVDLTSTIMVDEETVAAFNMTAREEIMLSGVSVAARVFSRYSQAVEFQVLQKDGARIQAGDVIGTVCGPARDILTAERTALNLIQHMSGIATATNQYVELIRGTKAQLLDTRKTTPGLRALEKHAVECGGGRNHRLSLDSGVLVKDNHIAVCGGLSAAIKRAKSRVPVLTKVEVECDTMDQVMEALNAGADMLLLDNMDNDTLREAVAKVKGRIPLEASGGINLDTIRAIAETGVDFISVGRITQSSPCVDIGLDEA